MPRFFVSPECIEDETVVIVGEDYKHIVKVLRMKTYDEITVCDLSGNDYHGVITNIDSEKVSIKINTISKSQGEPRVKVTLFQGVAKGDKMDYIVQKCVELGIFSIVPVITHRTIVQIAANKSGERKIERWQRICYEAAKQSGRGIVPEVKPVMSFRDAVKKSEEFDMAFIPYEKAKANLSCSLNNYLKELSVENSEKNICFFIGPEGGFEEEEILLSEEHGIKPISLGRRILRTETASLAFLAILMHLLGELN